MKDKTKTTRKKDKKKLWKCPLCDVSYFNNGEELTGFCIWMHVIRKDKYYKAMSEPITKPKK
jgi:hypothetical protein